VRQGRDSRCSTGAGHLACFSRGTCDLADDAPGAAFALKCFDRRLSERQHDAEGGNAFHAGLASWDMGRA
jgi:hypothetical protein